MKKKAFFIILLCLCAGGVYWLSLSGIQKKGMYSQVVPLAQNQAAQNEGPNLKEIWVGINKLSVEIADTSKVREKGLGGRDSLGEGQGMLFLFDRPDFYVFWMKDMKFAIDIIWIRGDRIVDIDRNVSPDSDSGGLPIYQPMEKADRVVEVNAGWVSRRQIKIGDEVRI